MRIVVIFLVAFSIQSFGQKQGNIWYFGPNGAGLDFNFCQPTVLKNGWKDSLNFYDVLFEGSTCISDTSGNLLFYSNGQSVFNSTHQHMQNGASVGSGGSTLSQNIIIPKPGSNSMYYLFSPEIQAYSGPGSVMYSEINMTLNSGLGAVVSAKQILRDTVGKHSCEMLTATRHSNGTDIWLIGHEHGNNTFFAYLITSAGINITPVISSIGPSIISLNGNNWDAIGEMKVSPDGTKIGFTTFNTGTSAIFNFNKLTGTITNPIALNISGSGIETSGYGLSFSPDNSKVYISTYITIDLFGNGIAELNQFDISNWNSTLIQGSRSLVYSSTNVPFDRLFSLKIGPDEKIYVGKNTGSQYLGVINSPNMSGTNCNYIHHGLYLNGLQVTLGLNNIMEITDYCGSVNGINAYNKTVSKVNFHPNPFSDFALIKFENLTGESYSLHLFNKFGTIVRMITDITNSEIKIERNNLAEGLYFFQLRNSNKIIGKGKFIVN